MYLHRNDAQESLAVWVFADATPAEWDLHFEHLRHVATWSAKTGKRTAALLVSRGEKGLDARRRAELVRLTEAPGYDPYVAFVTLNVPLRAALTMFGWIQKAPRYEMSIFSRSNDAFAWLEKKRESSLPTLATMLAEVRSIYESETGKELP